MSETIFDQPTSDPVIPPELTDLVGEGKKYATVEAALKSVAPSQSHIQKLEEEMKILREELQKRQTAEQLIEEMKQHGSPKDTPVGIDPDAISKIVEKTLSAREQQKLAKDNISTVVSNFNERFGEKGPEQYTLVAQNAGLTIEQLNALAASSPLAVLKLAGMDSTKQTTSVKQHSDVNTTIFSDQKPPTLSAKVKPVGASTKEVVAAWRNAGEMVKRELGIKE